MSTREKLLNQFRDLVNERLAKITRFLMNLESGPDRQAGQAALRELHGLKGEARMMGFTVVSAVVHEMEELVRVVEPLGYALGGGSVDALLASSDAVAVLAGAVAGMTADVPPLLEWLKRSLAAETERVAAAVPTSPPVASSTPTLPLAAPMSSSSLRPMPSVPVPLPTVPAPPPLPLPPPSRPEAAAQRTDSAIRISQHSLEVLTSAVTSFRQVDRRRERNSSRLRSLGKELSQLQRAAEELGPAAQEIVSRLSKAKEAVDDINRINTLIQTDEARELTLLAEEVQSIRMLPLGLLFELYPRMVRELARELGKEVELGVEGENERIDRTVLDVLRDPLLHLVRNAIDHGFETPADRVAAGKNARGSLRLSARREGERLALSVEDDGRGLDPTALRQIAVRRGLLDEAGADALSDDATLDLVFLPGFTSKGEATDISGRGVGLDVVKTKLQQIGGEVTLKSEVGKGATFEALVPLSLTVAPVLFVQTGDERFCVPATNVVRALQVDPEQVREIAGRSGVAIDDVVLPFQSIGTILAGAPDRAASAGESVLVVRGRGQTAAIGVDRVLDEQVQAILPLKGMLSRLSHFSGATQLPDGTVALVLSPAHLVATVHGREARLGGQTVTAVAAVRKRLLVVDDSPLTRELLVSLLESVGYDIVQASDGSEAIELLKHESVDAVVTDLEMPKIDGVELTRRLKGHPSFKRLPVVMVTTRGNDQDRQRGMAAGADAYVTKGDLVRQDLVDVVARLLA